MILFAKERKQVHYDNRLELSLVFICKTLNVTREDFASLAISNLLAEELDFIEHNSFQQIKKNEINKHKKTVNRVKFEADSWIRN